MNPLVLSERHRDLLFAGVIIMMIIGLPLSLILSSQRQNTKTNAQTPGAGSALRFTGTGTANVNRVNIPLNNPQRPADIGATDFTAEWWMQVNPGDVTNNGACQSGSYNWVFGDIFFDRDINGNGDFGDFGVSLFGSGLAFGVGNTSTTTTLCGTRNIADGGWHHVAVTRERSTGVMRIFVDGTLDVQGNGPAGDISYNDARSGDTWDPYLVLGAEKHNIVVPQFRGILDELRLSNVLRYTSNFARPTTTFVTDANTVGLYHFDEGSGSTLADTSGAAGGPSTGTLAVGGNPEGPIWVASSAPLSSDPNVTPLPTDVPATPTLTPTSGPQSAPGIAYSFSEGTGTTTADVSGNNLSGTITSGTWSNAGRYGSGLSFNGTSTRVRSASTTLNGPFTMMAWINNPTNNAYETIMTLGSNRDLYLRSGVPSFFDNSTERSFGNALPTNTWTHVALVYSGSDLRLYVNGVLQGSTQPLTLSSSTGVLQVGAWIDGSSNADFFSGLMDEVRLYRNALSQADIQAAMSAPYGNPNQPTPTPTIFQAPTVTPTPSPTATPAPTGAVQTVTLNPVADSYVDNASNATRSRNYGSVTVMNVDGSPASIGYMRFDLSSLAGRVITNATLRLRTSSDTSNNTQTVRPVSNITWSELGITYNNRPAVTNTALATINSQNLSNAWQQVNLTSTALANVGRPFSIAIDSSGSNNVWLWSRESTSRPELVIQYR